MLGKLEATASINTSWVELGLATCKKIAEALKGDIFLVDDEETDEQTLLPTKSELKSSQGPKKVEGTAIALVLVCPEISAKFKRRDQDNRPNFESYEEKDSLILYQ